MERKPKRIDVLTLFPTLFEGFLSEGLLGRAKKEGLLEVTLVDFREYGLGKHRSVDDDPYGGGAGMVLRPEPLFAAAREQVALRKSTEHCKGAGVCCHCSRSHASMAV